MRAGCPRSRGLSPRREHHAMNTPETDTTDLRLAATQLFRGCLPPKLRPLEFRGQSLRGGQIRRPPWRLSPVRSIPRPLRRAAPSACSPRNWPPVAGNCSRSTSARKPCGRRANGARDSSNIRFELRRLPADFPDGDFDLILISEVGYYLNMPDLLSLRDLCLSRLKPAGQLLLVHWTPFVHDYPLTGDQVHETFLQTTGPALRHLAGRREERYRLDLFEKP